MRNPSIKISILKTIFPRAYLELNSVQSHRVIAKSTFDTTFSSYPGGPTFRRHIPSQNLNLHKVKTGITDPAISPYKSSLFFPEFFGVS